MMTKPQHIIGITGTATEVGKTWTTAALCSEFRRRNIAVSARKPVQSCEPDDPDATTDGALLAAATGELFDDVCPPHRRYRVALAPPMAAAALGVECPTVDELIAEVRDSWSDDPIPGEPSPLFGCIETVGGTRSPTARASAAGDDSVALLQRYGVDATVLVADAGLGTIDAVRRSVVGCPGETFVVLNRYDPGDSLHSGNADWLTTVDDLAVVTSVVELADTLIARFAPEQAR